MVETYQIANVDRDEIDLFVTQRYIDDATRKEMENLLDMRMKIAALDTQIAGADKEIKEIGEDQARLRENIKALTQTAEARQLIARYVTKAGEQESRIEQLNRDRQTAAVERSRVQQQFEAAVRAFDIKREI